MNNSRKFRIRPSIDIAPRITSAFTLVELLVVMSIIGLLAALIISGAAIAISKSRKARAETERDALVTALENYKKARGYYPPDNNNISDTNHTYQNGLYYELTGTVIIGNPALGAVSYRAVDQEILDTNTMAANFAVDGFLNSSSDTTAPAVNFWPSMKGGESGFVTLANGNKCTLMGIIVPGPLLINPASPGGAALNPWHYISNHPTNSDEFDLWMDVSWGGKTNRVSNWSKEPQIVSTLIK